MDDSQTMGKTLRNGCRWLPGPFPPPVAHPVLLALLLLTAAALPPTAATAEQVATNLVTEQRQESAAPSLPSIDALQQRVKQVTDNTSLAEEVKKPLLESLHKTIETLQQIADLITRRKQAQAAGEAAPAETERAKALLAKPVTPPVLPRTDEEVPLETLRGDKVQADAKLAAAQRALQELESKLQDRNNRKGQLPKLIADDQSQMQKLESEPPTAAAEADPTLAEARATEWAASLQLVRERVQTRLQEQRLIEAEGELLPAQIELARREVAACEELVRTLGKAVNKRRSVKLEAELQAFNARVRAAGGDPDKSPVMRYAAAWAHLVVDNGRVMRELAQTQQRWAQLDKAFKEHQAEIDNDLKSDYGLRSGLGLKLQRERARLPSSWSIASEVAAVDAQIEQARVLQTDVETTLDELEGRATPVLPAGGGRWQPSSRATTGSVDETADIQASERELLRRFQTDINDYLDDLIALQGAHEKTGATIDTYRAMIDQHVMWIRSDQRFAARDLATMWGSFQWLVHPENLGELASTTLWEMRRRPDLVALWLVAACGLAFAGSRLRRRVVRYGELATKRNQTSIHPTLRAMVVSFLLAAMTAGIIAIPGWRLYVAADAASYVHAVGFALLVAAAIVLQFELLRQLVRPNGLATAHFSWKEETVRPLRTTLRWAIDIGVPVAMVWLVATQSGSTTVSSTLGRPLFAAFMLMLAWGMWRVLHPRTGMVADYLSRRPGGWVDRLHYIWHPTLAAIPVALAMLSLAGYRYSAEQLSVQLYKTLWLGIALALIGGCLRRWVLLNRRQLALAALRSRAAANEKREALPIEIAEEDRINLTELNAQTLRLIYALLAVLAVVGLAWTWSPVLPAVGYLERVEFDSLKSIGPDGEVIPFTLANLLLPIPIITLTIVAVRNIPGLLETVLLQRLPLDNATRYAITTLSSYTLLVVGISLSAHQLGLRWENIQWLLAALSVGLGFGLQEIFANFISGIILLFEQPIRVGDVVTLDNTTGVVSRIRIRATTVTNWERQELIIPNKDLITGRLVNWTLSDSTNRVLINVGVAFGSDTRRACEVLDEICRNHPNVLEDPPPVVTFEGFGESRLNLVVRCYLSALDVRLVTMHELHTEINERFKQEGFEISFPQRDLHIRSLPPGLVLAAEKKKAAA